VYPYEHMDCWERFNDNEFPSHDKFHSTLNGTNISETDYQRGLLVWDHCNIKTIGEYHVVYLTLDVLLLSVVMLKLKKLLFHCGLDAAQFIQFQIIVGLRC